MEQPSSLIEVPKIRITNFKQPVVKKCRECKSTLSPSTMSGGAGISTRQCLLCRQKKQQSAMKERLKKKKNKEKRLKRCLECLKNKRKKGKTKCASCIRKYDVMYWGKRAWAVFAKWLKKKAGDSFECYTCYTVSPIAKAQAGHCFHRGRDFFRAIDFDPDHIRLQDGNCNLDMRGQRQIFQHRLTMELGVEQVADMINQRHKAPALTIPELQAIISNYTV